MYAKIMIQGINIYWLFKLFYVIFFYSFQEQIIDISSVVFFKLS